MLLFQRLLYDLLIRLYGLGIAFSALFNEKARQWVKGRRHLLSEIREKIPPGEEIIWFHCASLGEFEQARPVIQKFKTQDSKLKIVVTFFSPSGYEVRKDYKHADHVFYLPLDTKRNAAEFIRAINPKLAVFVKYEFWYHYLNELSRREIPAVLIAANFREDQPFFRWYGALFRKMLGMFTAVLVQNERSRKLLQQISISATTAGDTRFDRVWEIKESGPAYPEIEEFAGNNKILIAGSTWPAEEKLLTRFAERHDLKKLGLKMIIAPHEIHPEKVDSLSGAFPAGAASFSHWSSANKDASVMIIDRMGLLSALYRYGNMALIGGGFGAGIHNILEPAVFGLPVLFGPRHDKFQEAKDLLEKGGAFCIQNYLDFEKHLLRLIEDEDVLQNASKAAASYVQENKGATEAVIKLMQEKNLL